MNQRHDKTEGLQHRPAGIVLVAVLWIVALLTVMVTVIAKTTRLDNRMLISRSDAVRSYWAIKAGVERGIALLNDDFATSDSLMDIWWDNEEDCNDIRLQGCVFSIRITDEARKLNINSATKKQLMHLPDMTEEIADSILDWRDDNHSISAQGAEAGYYRNLHPAYEIRNGPFQTLRELLLVKEMDRQLLFGEDTNLNGQLDYHENDGDQNSPVDNEDDRLDKGWFDLLTCYSYEENKDKNGNKRININKADEQALINGLDISSRSRKLNFF